MEHPLVAPLDAGTGQNTPVESGSRPSAKFAPELRTQAILYGILAAAILTGLIALG